MLNSNIKIDLHIHSIASKYKEGKYKGTDEYIVDYSTKDNIETLLDKLISNEVTLFSITDHNRYDAELYKTIKEKLNEEKYNKLSVLHGIEFDVKLENNKEPVHIISIFDVKNDENISSIVNAMKTNELTGYNAFFDKNQFESVLKDIGLDTILIVHQKCSLDKSEGGHKSLSEGVTDPYKIIQVGYINALEYQKPNIEGILKDNLRKIDSDVALITGSDCHDWRYYPKHDKESNNINNHYFSKCKILPTFKGLLLGLTSPKSRFNRNALYNTNYLKSFEINGNTVDLDPGINVIIGENGSGKSTLFSLLNNDATQKHIRDLKEINKIIVNNNNYRFKAIKQSELIEKFQKDELFNDDNYFSPINTADFKSKYSIFSSNLKKYIEVNIIKKSSYDSLDHINFVLNFDYEITNTMYISVDSNGLNLEENEHTERRIKLLSIMVDIYNEYVNDYYDKTQKLELYASIKHIKRLYDDVLKKHNKIELENKIKNIFISKIKEYSINISNLSNTQDNEILDYKNKKDDFVAEIIKTIRINSKNNSFPAHPGIFNGSSTRRYKGYVFNREAAFNNKDMLDDFYENMFVKSYRGQQYIASIDNHPDFAKAILKCTLKEEIDNQWENNCNKFIKQSEEQKSYIKEETKGESIGNTLGEMSLVYYKFETYENDEWDILMIDQPEDNISNIRIAEKLIKYFHDIRKNKQLILVTHNPLLVVNLDVDNVIVLNKENNVIRVEAGCLEDEENAILDRVAKTLDGGKEMIEKRLKIYGKNN